MLFQTLNRCIVGSSFDDILETELSDSTIQDAVADDAESCCSGCCTAFGNSSCVTMTFCTTVEFGVIFGGGARDPTTVKSLWIPFEVCLGLRKRFLESN